MHGMMTDREGALAICASYHALGDYIAASAAEDAIAIGVSFPPEIRPVMIPVSRGTDEQRMARISQWAAARGVTAGWHEGTGTWRAVIWFGLLGYGFYTIADEDAAARVARRIEAIKASSREMVAASRAGSAA